MTSGRRKRKASKRLPVVAGALTAAGLTWALYHSVMDGWNMPQPAAIPAEVSGEDSSGSLPRPEDILNQEGSAGSSEEPQLSAHSPDSGDPDPFYEDIVRVEKNSSVYDTLRKAGLNPGDIHHLVSKAKAHYDLRKIHMGTRITLKRSISDQNLVEVRFHLSRTQTLYITPKNNAPWQAEIREKPVAVRPSVFYGEVRGNLWTSAIEGGLDPQAISGLADIFAWQIDFEREVRPGDTWRILIERQYVDNKPYGWGNILIAEYKRGSDHFAAIRYPIEGDEGDYYNWDGDSLRGRFLKSPLRYSRISSKFQMKRFHPILGVARPHYGVDYAAAHGTPIRAVGDGVVTIAGRRGGSGHMIKLRHNAVYQTAYKHLSAYAKGIRSGARVSQGQVIGFVGATGLATGPHLHFEFYEKGKYVDPLGKKFPREESVPSDQLADFKRVAEVARQRLAQSLQEVYQVAEKEG